MLSLHHNPPLFSGPIYRLGLDGKIGRGIVPGVPIPMIDVLVTDCCQAAPFSHFSSGCVTPGTTANLLGLAVVLTVFLFVIAFLPDGH